MKVVVAWRGGALQDFIGIEQALTEVRAIYPEAFYRLQEVEDGETLRVWETSACEEKGEQPIASLLRSCE